MKAERSIFSDSEYHEFENSFNTVVMQYGGRLNRENIHVFTKSGLNELLDYYYWLIRSAQYAPEPYNPTGKLYVDFVDSPRCNAIAFEKDNREFIGIFLGAVARIYHIFYLFMSSPKVLIEIGEAFEESVDKKRIIELHTKDPDGSWQALRPKNESRFRVAQHLAWNAMAFLFGHEIAHICRAHLKYLETEIDSTEYLEYPFTAISPQVATQLQQLELDADTAAGEVNMILWRQHIQGGTFPLLSEISPIKTWGISLALLFRILDFEEKRVRPHYHQTHPIPAVRFMQIVYEGTSEFGENLEANHAQSLGEAFRIVDAWWKESGLATYSFRSFDEDIEKTIDELDSLRSGSKELHSSLRNLTEVRNKKIRKNKV